MFGGSVANSLNANTIGTFWLVSKAFSLQYSTKRREVQLRVLRKRENLHFLTRRVTPENYNRKSQHIFTKGQGYDGFGTFPTDAHGIR